MNDAAIADLLRERHPCILIGTREEPEALDAVQQAALRLPGRPRVLAWSCTQGLHDPALATPTPAPDSNDPLHVLAGLRHIFAEAPTIVVLMDLLEHWRDADPKAVRIRREWRELYEWLRRRLADGLPHAHLVMIDHDLEAPPLVEALAVRFEPQAPDDKQIAAIMKRTLEGLAARPGAGKIRVHLSDDEKADLVSNMRGLSARQIEQLTAELVLDDRAITPGDIPRLIRGKRRILQGHGVLEFVDSPASLTEVGGMAGLKAWLEQRARAFDREARDFGLPAPRGVLLLGVPGSGKSLAAKAIATAWRRPLMRLDAGRLYDRYVGESERRLRDALAQAQAMAPVILWIDEIEKAFASAAAQSTDGGLSQRMFGTLLTWMQEHQSAVFLVATANNIEALPPELLRKGRFDEIFFVDLPGPEAREAIIRVHINKRTTPANQQHIRIDPRAVAEATDGYSGAELEQGVVAAFYAFFARRDQLTTQHLITELLASPPLSVKMASLVQRMRHWAHDRCRDADDLQGLITPAQGPHTPA